VSSSAAVSVTALRTSGTLARRHCREARRACPGQAIVYTVTTLAKASHTLAIEVTGQKNAAAADSLIYVDAIDAQSRAEDDDPAITYSGSWVQDTARNWSASSLQTGSGTAKRAATAGALTAATRFQDSVSMQYVIQLGRMRNGRVPR